MKAPPANGQKLKANRVEKVGGLLESKASGRFSLFRFRNSIHLNQHVLSTDPGLDTGQEKAIKIGALPYCSVV